MHQTRLYMPTVKAIRKLKDGQGQYLWQPSLTAGTPDTLLNRPVYTSAYAPIIEAGAKTIAFGDFGYYWIADRQGRSFKRLNELFATTGQVGFLASQRVDGKLISNEYRITLKGTLSHTVTLGADVFGNIARLDNALENLAGSLQAEQSSLEETKGQLENARAELGAPFAREEELAEKTARLNELNVLLKVDEKDKTLIDSVPDEGEEVPERKVVGLER